MPGDATHHARSPQIPRWFHKKCGIVSQGFLNAGSGNWFPAHVANHGYHAALRGESIKGTFDHGAHFNFLPPSMTLVSEYHSFSAGRFQPVVFSQLDFFTPRRDQTYAFHHFFP